MLGPTSPIVQQTGRIKKLAADAEEYINAIRQCIEQRLDVFEIAKDPPCSHSLKVSIYGQEILFRVEVEFERGKAEIFPNGFIRIYALSTVEPKEMLLDSHPFPNISIDPVWGKEDQKIERDKFAAKILNSIFEGIAKDEVSVKNGFALKFK